MNSEAKFVDQEQREKAAQDISESYIVEAAAGTGKTTVTSPRIRYSPLRLRVIGGLIIGILHVIVQVGIVFGLILKSPYMSSLQYVASGAMGDSAFADGLATARLGLILEFVITIIIAGIFIFSADRIALLQKNVIVGSLLYGFGVFIVMNFIVRPLSAEPPLPAPPMWLLIEIILEHVLLIGLPLGLLVRWNDRTNR